MAREMKNSGVQWIGDIPKEWKMIPNKYIMHKIKAICPKYNGENILSLSVRGVNVRDLDAGGKMPTTFNGYQRVYSGNLLMCLFDMDVTPCCIGRINNNGLTSPAYSQFIIHKGANRDYYYYYYLMLDNTKELVHLAKNLRHSITEEQLGNIKIPSPSLAEQKAIADYLDKKCKEIDGLLADLDAEVKTLAEYKKSIIAETVTRGLNPNAPMKQVELGWIEEIPTNWEIARIASVYSIRNEKVSDKDYPPLSVTMKGIVPQLDSAAKTKHGDERKLIRKGDFVINSRSDRRGSCGISDYDGSCSLINTVLAPREEMNPRYYNWLFHTTSFADEFYKWGYGIVDDLWTTNWGAMRRIQIPMPPLEEQENIAKFLDNKVPQIDETIANKLTQIETLKSYKASLIYEYVTGKKQVAL